ncbi:MAG: co-chaperone DjlA [Pseudomonadota bacterium]
MSLRDRSGVQVYWGKLVGTLLGAATLKPWLALLGLILGHQFDRGFSSRFRAFSDAGAKAGSLPEAFVPALFQAMGHLAKVDGRVSEDEIRAARSVMHRLNLGPAAVRRAIADFEEGKRPAFPFAATLARLRRDALRRPEHRLLFVRLLLEVGLSKPRMRAAERALIWEACTAFDIGRVELAQLEAMLRAQKSFRQTPAGDADRDRVSAAYSSLGVRPDASNKDIKTAYRRLMNQSHPDKLSGNNPDAQQLAAAEQKTREVRAAYELLKARRSIR